MKYFFVKIYKLIDNSELVLYLYGKCKMFIDVYLDLNNYEGSVNLSLYY